jgi:hypothetical protein
MLKLGFWKSWVDKVMKCVTVVSRSVLFNGEQLRKLSQLGASDKEILFLRTCFCCV